MRSPTYWIWSKQSNAYIKTFSTLSGVRKVFLFILVQLDIFAQVQWKDTVIKTTIHRTRVTCFLCTGVYRSKKNLLPNSWDLNLVKSLLWRALQQKLYRQDFRDVDRLKHVLLHCWDWKIRCNWRVPDQLLKRVVMVFRVHNRHVELLLTYWY